jgi:hypothetical protein
MSDPLTDSDQDDQLREVAKFLSKEQKKLLDLIDEGPDEFSYEAIFGETNNT